MRAHLLDRVPSAIVSAASWFVPRSARTEWRAEWCAELWHLAHEPHRHEREPSGITPLAFSLGAVQDAFWLGAEEMHAGFSHMFHPGSAARCQLILAALSAIGFLACLILPGAHRTLQGLPYPKARDLVIISSKGVQGTRQPSIRLEDYREWRTDTGDLYSQIAFYAPMAGRIHLSHYRTADLSIAVASGNLLHLLGISRDAAIVPLRPASGRLLLSRSAWKRWYRSDASIFGQTAHVTGQEVIIAGVLPETDWRLPGRVDALLLEESPGLDGLQGAEKGFVLARIRDSAFPPPRDGWRSMIETRDGTTRWYACISLENIEVPCTVAFLFSLLLAILALPAITALSLGDYPLSREPLRRKLVACRWLFLATKFVMVVAIVYLWSGDLAFGPRWSGVTDGAAIQALASFLPLLFGFRWVLQDQRNRCPVCLRLLSNPARVGQSSCNFLGWCGTELMCASGHGLLHIPELPTSWFRTQRWLCLDSSWRCLFKCK